MSNSIVVEGLRKSFGDREVVSGIGFEVSAGERIGVVLQETELLPTLTVAETISMFADLYADPRSVPEVLDLVGMSRMGSARVAGLSGGERRRVDVAVGLVGNPEL